VAQGGDEAAGVDGEEGLRLLVRVDFDVLVGDALVFEGDPDALDKGAESVSEGSLGAKGGRYTRMRCRRALGRFLVSGF